MNTETLGMCIHVYMPYVIIIYDKSFKQRISCHPMYYLNTDYCHTEPLFILQPCTNDEHEADKVSLKQSNKDGQMSTLLLPIY